MFGLWILLQVLLLLPLGSYRFSTTPHSSVAMSSTSTPSRELQGTPGFLALNGVEVRELLLPLGSYGELGK